MKALRRGWKRVPGVTRRPRSERELAFDQPALSLSLSSSRQCYSEPEMITGLRAQNFKSWKDTGELRIAPLTGLFGANSSGKTGILQALLVIKQSAEAPDPGRALYLGDERTPFDLGTFSDVIHGHNADLELSVRLCWQVRAAGSVEVGCNEVDGDLHLSRFICKLGDKTLRVREESGGFSCTSDDVNWFDTESPWGLHTASVHQPDFALQSLLERVSYLGPLRQRPRRAPYVWSGSTPWGVGADGGGFAQALLSTLSGRRTVEAVAGALRDMKLIDGFRIEVVAPGRRDYEIRLRKTGASAEVLLPDVGFGVSQVLPVLVLCYYADEGSTLVIEQPELHLHPAAQSELADVLIDVVKNRKMQIILESHSEHLLRRLQRRIAEGQFAAADAALYFCEMENGASKCTPLEITDDGFIRNWPKDFFGDEMGELAATTEEAMKHRLSQGKVTFVVDTNVIVVANDREADQTTAGCVLSMCRAATADIARPKNTRARFELTTS